VFLPLSYSIFISIFGYNRNCFRAFSMEVCVLKHFFDKPQE